MIDYAALEQQWQRTLRKRKPNKFDPIYSDEDILEAAHSGSTRALDMIAFNRQWPTRRHWHHQVHMDFGLPCDSECAPKLKPYAGDSLIARIKAAYDIVEVAEQLTELRGVRTMSGKCPLHGETRGTAFVVWPESQTWRCFGACGIGGDVVDLFRAMKERGMAWSFTR